MRSFPLTLSYAAFCGVIAASAALLLPSLRSADATDARPVPVESKAAAPDAAVPRLTERVRAEATLIDARAPVPLLLTPRAPVSQFSETAIANQVASAAPGDTAAAAALPPPAADSAAKALIEADGYKRVRMIERRADGKWRAVALRGTVEIALNVDDAGNISSE